MLGPLLAGVIKTDPDSLDSNTLHGAAYAVMRPQCDASRSQAAEQFAALLGGGGERAATGMEDVISAAYQSRIETLLLAEDVVVWGSYDENADEVTMQGDSAAAGEDLLDHVVVQPPRHRGSVHILPREDVPYKAPAVAILRY
jgi:stalled ribosome rescue protein Dom34